MENHINGISMNLKTRLACLCQRKFISSLNTRKIIANGVFNRGLTYCMPLRGEIEYQDFNNLQVLHNRAVPTSELLVRLPPRSSRNIFF